MMEKDDIKDLFAKSLSEHQIPVDPSLWATVSSSLATSAAKTGIGIFAKSIIGISAVTIAVVTTYFVYLNSSEVDSQSKKPIIQSVDRQQQDNKPAIESLVFQDDKNGTTKTDLNRTSTELQADHYPNHVHSTPQIQEIDDSELPNAIIHLSPLSSTSNRPVSNTVSAENLHQNQNAQAVTTAVVHYPHITAQPEATTLAPKRATTKPTLPNIFTPNGDGQNDLLLIDWKGLEVSDFSLVVLSSNNQVVYRSNNPEFRWDGTDLGGEKLPRGFYIYFVTTQIDNDKWQQSSSLQIQY